MDLQSQDTLTYIAAVQGYRLCKELQHGTININGGVLQLPAQLASGSAAVQVTFDSVKVYPGFTEDDIIISGDNTKVVVTITTIKANISLSGMLFEIELSPILFNNNTEGLCGTCSNNRADDCRLPDGNIISDCSVMASYWKFENLSKPYCNRVTTSPSTVTLSGLTTYCESASICFIISSQVFDECHQVVPYEVFLKQCLSSSCDPADLCDHVTAYAEQCTIFGKCTDWRNDTVCTYNCSDSKIYKPCNNLQQPTCIERNPILDPNFIGDTCVCPNNTILDGTIKDKCVTQCECVGPNGELKKPGETWSPPNDTCIQYICKKDFEVITIKTVCPPFDPSNCEQGTITTDSTGCCKTCQEKQVKCVIHIDTVIINFNNCTSRVPVNATFCEGFCTSSSMYSFSNQKMEQVCKCCIPTKTSEREINLACQDGTSLNYKYPYIEECDCSVPTCKNVSDGTIN
ncbi:intestinal mucin-like protein [Rhinoderma darwinii]|uniref:intestinal mucin-like protein n=1 Tax=Rhinoderma darwinii TaxID=43563 RepID=UPI003F6695A8